jgi:putative nucleotidyltransferase with HDIG domain
MHQLLAEPTITKVGSATERGVRSDGRDRPSAVISVGAALEAALELRAPGVHASTPMVRQLAAKVARELGLDADTRALLDLAARTRDIGMIALPDQVVLATTRLSPADWELVNQHPVIGADLLEGLSLTSAAQAVRGHHERWDGAGYPDGRSGNAIPLLSRVIATCDGFVAMASDRPYRRGIGAEAALEHVRRERASQFDPAIVDALVAVLAGTSDRMLVANGNNDARTSTRVGPRIKRPGGDRGDLMTAIEELEVVPVFAPAYERLAAAVTDDTSGGGVVAAIESDTGLTVAVLRRAQSAPSRRPIKNVADAVDALTRHEIAEAVEALPRLEFPWRSSELEVLMHRSRIHAQAVTRAADRIARAANLVTRDDVLVTALLHDIGKLVLGRVVPGYVEAIDARTTTPENRIRQEQQALGTDHAGLGGLLLRRWGLPSELASAVSAHHSSETAGEVATYVRLADMVAHHTQGECIDRGKMMGLCHICGLSASELRDVLFDLPHAGGSQRRRAEASPLSDRETEVLRVLAQGKLYKAIALELGVGVTTVRSHVHNVCEKLGVPDRANAVLRATEMGWV